MAWNGSGSENKVGAPNHMKSCGNNASRALLRVVVAAMAVILVGSVILFFLQKQDDGEIKRKVKSVDKAISEVQSEACAENFESSTAESVAKSTESRRIHDGVEVVSSSVVTNQSGAVIEKLVLANGRRTSLIHPPKPLFNNASDQVIALMLSTTPGQSMPPLPALDESIEDAFLKSLLNPIRIDEGDTPQIREAKGKVMEARAYIANEIKNGKTVRQIIKEYQQEMQLYNDSHVMAIHELQKVREESGDEAAREFADRVNESFRARGIPEIMSTNTDTGNERSHE